MYAEYKRDMSHNYLILHGENPVDTSSYQVRMLTGNAVPSILKCRIQGLDGNFLFYYDITSRQSLASIRISFCFRRNICIWMLRSRRCISAVFRVSPKQSVNSFGR